MKASVRVNRNRPYSFSVYGKKQSEITLTEIRITDCLRGKKK